MLTKSLFSLTISLGLATITCAAAAASKQSPLNALSPAALKLFKQGMDFNEAYWDELEGFLYGVDVAGIHDSRATAMWVPALLARNKAGDVDRAIRIIETISAEQYTYNTSVLWWGTYPHTPQDPLPGSGLIGVKPYDDYDPNWRDFVGSAWCLALAQSEHLLPKEIVKILESSLYTAALSLSKRYQARGEYPNGANVNTTVDNLDPAYTNPWLMGTFLAGYVGHRLNDANLTTKADEDAQAIYNLFMYGKYNTFSEYNSGTYTGVDLYALALWVKYMPSTSKLAKLGPEMLTQTLTDLGDLYNADLRNLAGPWDRTYGYDMQHYHSILGYFITSLAPTSSWASPRKPFAALHINDFACYGSLASLVSPFLDPYLPESTKSSWKSFNSSSTRLIKRIIRTNIEDPSVVRNVTAYLAANLSMGAQSIDEPTPRAGSYVGAVIQWALHPSPLSKRSTLKAKDVPPRVGYIALTPMTASRLESSVSEGKMALSFPPSPVWTNVTQASEVTFAVGGFNILTDLSDAGKAFQDEGIQGLSKGLLDVNVTLDGMVLDSVVLNTGGYNGFYPFTVKYNLTAVWPAVPSMTIEIKQ